MLPLNFLCSEVYISQGRLSLSAPATNSFKVQIQPPCIARTRYLVALQKLTIPRSLFLTKNTLCCPVLGVGESSRCRTPNSTVRSNVTIDCNRPLIHTFFWRLTFITPLLYRHRSCGTFLVFMWWMCLYRVPCQTPTTLVLAKIGIQTTSGTSTESFLRERIVADPHPIRRG